jgi:hypothetical protein
LSGVVGAAGLSSDRRSDIAGSPGHRLFVELEPGPIRRGAWRLERRQHGRRWRLRFHLRRCGGGRARVLHQHRRPMRRGHRLLRGRHLHARRGRWCDVHGGHGGVPLEGPALFFERVLLQRSKQLRRGHDQHLPLIAPQQSYDPGSSTADPGPGACTGSMTHMGRSGQARGAEVRLKERRGRTSPSRLRRSWSCRPVCRCLRRGRR